MMKGKKKGGWIVGALVACGLMALAGYNLYNNADFWEASAVNCITIAIAVLVSYFLVQKQNDQRKQKEILLDLIYKLQAQIVHPSMYDVAGMSKEELTMRNRSVGNKIHILKKAKEKFEIEDEVAFVQERFDEYNTLIGDHIENETYLQQSKRELKRPLDLMDGKLIEMAMKLFE